jgi:CheY-like chemotaxis protein
MPYPMSKEKGSEQPASPAPATFPRGFSVTIQRPIRKPELLHLSLHLGGSDLRHPAKKTLVRHGYHVLAAADGETALNIYRRSKEAIDVVLLDIGLPKVAGGDVLLKIKNENPDVKVVIASGYLEPKLRSEIDRAGVKYFLPKPYRPDEVVKALQSLIEGKS